MKRLGSSVFALCALSASAAVPERPAPLGIAWGFLYGYKGTKAEVYMPQLRQLGAGMTKVYLFWNQLEPEKGRYDWSASDAFVNQLHSPEEGLISVFSSSLWATRRASAMLPPSPAKDPADYYRFIHAMVLRYKGRSAIGRTAPSRTVRSSGAERKKNSSTSCACSTRRSRMPTRTRW